MSAARTVTVRTSDHGSVTTPEPAWCLGDHADGGYRADVLHLGPDHVLTFWGEVLLDAGLALSPFAERPANRTLRVGVGPPLGQSLTPADVDELAAALVEYAATLRHLARQLGTLLAGGAR